MITAQDIREKGFERVRLNGYDMAAVDDFLEELADDVAATQKENAVLKSKMKVLVDKIEEYRANEEALNSAILSAQKLAVQIETEARQRAAATIADAEKQAQDTIGGITARADAEEKRLADAKMSCSKFFESAKAIFGDQLEKLEAIRTGMGLEAPKAAAPAAEADDPVRAIESSAARFQAEADRARRLENTQPFTL